MKIYKSYRPICLNSNISKIFEKIINNKLIKFYEDSNLLNNRQHGFRRSRSTISALNEIVKIALEHKNKEYTAIIAVDISGAFDNAWWPMVLKRLDEDNVQASIIKLLQSFLNNRRVRFRYSSNETHKNLSKGCPQGGPISPTIWNIILNDLLNNYSESNSEIIAYADDLTVICWGKQLDRTSEYNRKGHGENIRLKTKILYLFNSKIAAKIPNTITANRVEKLNIMGITFKNHRNKNKLDFVPHIDEIITKTNRASGYLIGLTGKAWGLDSKRRIELYKTLFRSSLTYGSTIWYNFIPKKVKDKLNSLQYKILKHSTQVYNSTSSNCTHIVARTPKLTDFIETNILKMNIGYKISDPTKRKMISNFINQKFEEYYGGANDNFKGFFDTSRIPNYVQPNFYNVQFLTGHGDFNTYLFRIGKIGSPACTCGNEQQTPEHLLIDCPLTSDLREENQLYLTNTKQAACNKDQYIKFNRFCRMWRAETGRRRWISFQDDRVGKSAFEDTRWQFSYPPCELYVEKMARQWRTDWEKEQGTGFDDEEDDIEGPHLNNSLLKYRWILPRLTSTIKGQFGSTFSSGHKIYKIVVLPALLHGSGVWGKRAYDTNGARKLRTLHYKYAKAIIRGGPCTPTIPAISLTGCPPFDISIKAHIEYLKTLKTGHYESRPSPSFLPYPPLRKIIYFTKSLQLNVTTIYTDGSQLSEGVGAGVILPPPLQTIQLKLHQECSAFQAELLAILYATKITMNFPKEHFIIASDCQSALSAICRSWPPRTQLIAEIIYNLHFHQICNSAGSKATAVFQEMNWRIRWQRLQHILICHYPLPLYQRASRAVKKEQIALIMWTDLYIQDYSTRNLRRFAATPKLLLQMLRNIKHGTTSTTILTGHGYIQADLATVSKEDPTCPHCQDEDQTVDHLLFTCPTFQYQRFQTATLLGITNICSASLENLPRKKSAWRHLINWTSTGI
ncbi:hypothetical protein LAZ67_15002513, partial [Cordylochernes scorpioides]